MPIGIKSISTKKTAPAPAQKGEPRMSIAIPGVNVPAPKPNVPFIKTTPSSGGGGGSRPVSEAPQYTPANGQQMSVSASASLKQAATQGAIRRTEQQLNRESIKVKSQNLLKQAISDPSGFITSSGNVFRNREQVLLEKQITENRKQLSQRAESYNQRVQQFERRNVQTPANYEQAVAQQEQATRLRQEGIGLEAFQQSIAKKEEQFTKNQYKSDVIVGEVLAGPSRAVGGTIAGVKKILTTRPSELVKNIGSITPQSLAKGSRGYLETITPAKVAGDISSFGSSLLLGAGVSKALSAGSKLSVVEQKALQTAIDRADYYAVSSKGVSISKISQTALTKDDITLINKAKQYGLRAEEVTVRLKPLATDEAIIKKGLGKTDIKVTQLVDRQGNVLRTIGGGRVTASKTGRTIRFSTDAVGLTKGDITTFLQRTKTFGKVSPGIANELPKTLSLDAQISKISGQKTSALNRIAQTQEAFFKGPSVSVKPLKTQSIETKDIQALRNPSFELAGKGSTITQESLRNIFIEQSKAPTITKKSITAISDVDSIAKRFSTLPKVAEFSSSKVMRTIGEPRPITPTLKPITPPSAAPKITGQVFKNIPSIEAVSKAVTTQSSITSARTVLSKEIQSLTKTRSAPPIVVPNQKDRVYFKKIQTIPRIVQPSLAKVETGLLGKSKQMQFTRSIPLSKIETGLKLKQVQIPKVQLPKIPRSPPFYQFRVPLPTIAPVGFRLPRLGGGSSFSRPKKQSKNKKSGFYLVQGFTEKFTLPKQTRSLKSPKQIARELYTEGVPFKLRTRPTF